MQHTLRHYSVGSYRVRNVGHVSPLIRKFALTTVTLILQQASRNRPFIGVLYVPWFLYRTSVAHWAYRFKIL